MNIKNLCLSFGLQEVFDDVSILIKEHEKVGVVGVNGAGKSTFFKILLKEIEPDSGKVILPNGTRVGFLPQVISDEADMNMNVFEYLLSGRPIKELQNDLEKAYVDVSNEVDEKKIDILYKKISKLQSKLEYYDVYNYENVLLKIVDGMNIDIDLLDLKLKDLSGGQKSKVAFARVLYSMPEMLLLDEPTNHLDEGSKEYIINYLKNYKGTVLVISHDIDFLDSVTTQTLYLDKMSHKMELFNGNYEKYLKILDERRKTKERLLENQEREEERLKKIIAKYIRGNEKKANIAKDRQKKLEKLLEEKVVIEKKGRVSNFHISVEDKSGITPISVKNLSFGFDDNMLYKDLTFDLSRGEKFLVVGEVGVGKSTLLKLILGLYEANSGSVVIGDKTTIGYYAQEHEIIDKDKSIYDNFKEFGLSERALRSFLGSFLFSGDDVYKKVSVLSPGERSRVGLAKVALMGANTLILDEPTNHLDPQTQELIAKVFRDYDGTMLIVSHNLEFVDNLGIDRMLILPSGEIKYYDKMVVKHYQELNKI